MNQDSMRVRTGGTNILYHNTNDCNVCQDAFGTSENMAAANSKEEVEEMKQDNKYELPEEQQTEEAKEAEEEENLPAIMQEAFEMEEEMMDIEKRTNKDGTVVGYVKEISMTKKGGTIAVDVDLPAEPDLERFHFEKPKSWIREYRWVRFVEEYVGGSQKIANFIDMTDEDDSIELSGQNGQDVSVKVKKREDDYEIVIPRGYPDYLYALSRQRYGLTEQEHIIWRLLPIGVGVWTGLTFSVPLVPGLISFFLVAAGGAMTAGFLLLVFGALFLGWGEDY